MKFLTDRKAALQTDIQKTKEEFVQRETEQLRMNEIRNWITTHPVGLQRYDDQITRELIEKITVVNKETIRISFINDETEVVQKLQ